MLTHNVGKKFTQSDGGKGPKLQLDLCSVEYCANFTLGEIRIQKELHRNLLDIYMSVE